MLNCAHRPCIPNKKESTTTRLGAFHIMRYHGRQHEVPWLFRVRFAAQLSAVWLRNGCACGEFSVLASALLGLSLEDTGLMSATEIDDLESYLSERLQDWGVSRLEHPHFLPVSLALVLTYQLLQSTDILPCYSCGSEIKVTDGLIARGR